MSKGILGVGCSYTWGEGLQFYANMESTEVSKIHNFAPHHLREPHYLFKDANRFITLVANHFNTWSVANKNNGGTNLGMINEILNPIICNNRDIHPSDIGLVIVQFTQANRDFDDGGIKLSEKELNDKYTEQVELFNSVLRKYELLGIKVISLLWNEAFWMNNAYQRLFKDRHIDIVIDGYMSHSFDYFIHNDEYGITVRSDFKKYGYQINDIHFNLKGHKIISELIIDKLKKDNFKIDINPHITNNYIKKIISQKLN